MARRTRLLVPLLLAAPSAFAFAVVADGRRVTILKDDAAVALHLCSRVAALANEAIAIKGSFAMSIGSGTTVAPLRMLAGDVDFSRVHVFFGNDRTEGEAAGKCFDGAAEFVSACGVPTTQVYRVPPGPAEVAAAAYEELLRGSAVLGMCERNGLPALDLVLLGSGADGHTASLYPDSEQVLRCGDGRVVVPAEVRGGSVCGICAPAFPVPALWPCAPRYEIPRAPDLAVLLSRARAASRSASTPSGRHAT